jgi:hypothetical protein
MFVIRNSTDNGDRRYAGLLHEMRIKLTVDIPASMRQTHEQDADYVDRRYSEFMSNVDNAIIDTRDQWQYSQ